MSKSKRFVIDHSYSVNYDKYCILDKVQHKHLYLDEVCKKLNEQQETIKQLQGKVKRLNTFHVERGLVTEYLEWNKEK